MVRPSSMHQLQKGDLIGVSLDLSVPEISFTVNGIRVKGFFRDFNLDGMFFPVISVSAKVRWVKLAESCDCQAWKKKNNHRNVFYENLVEPQRIKVQFKYVLTSC